MTPGVLGVGRQGTRAPRVQPLRDVRDIERVRAILHNKPRDLLLFDLATHTGAKMGALLQLKVSDLLGLRVGEHLRCLEDGTNASTPTLMKNVLYETFQRYLEAVGPSSDDYLFKSRKGSRPLHISSVSHMARNWFEAANLKGLTAYRSLRETGRMQFQAGLHDRGSLSEHQGLQNALRPAEVLTLQENVYLQLFKAIVSGQIRPGERLVTQELAKQMRVSPMPVRDALGRLEALGFLSRQKRRGYAVNELSKNDLGEITRIRLVLESLAAEAACRQSTEEVLNALGTLHDQYRRAVDRKDVDEVLRVNRQFHFTVYRSAQMPILEEIIEGLWNRVSPYLYILLKITGSSGEKDEARRTVKNHEGMLHGMRTGNPQEICESIRADIENAAQLASRMLK
jgi:DNA-binding GntR family transcriptional regulator